MSCIVSVRLKEKERRGEERGGEGNSARGKIRSLEIEHVCVLVLSFVCTFLSSVEAMHTLTALLYHLQQNVDRFEKSRQIISERHKTKPGPFDSTMNTLHGLFCVKYT